MQFVNIDSIRIIKAKLTFDSSWILRERSESCGSFVFDRVRSRVEQFEDAFDISSLDLESTTAGTLKERSTHLESINTGSSDGFLSDQFDDGELHHFVESGDVLVDGEEVVDGSSWGGCLEHDKGVSKGRRVGFLCDEGSASVGVIVARAPRRGEERETDSDHEGGDQLGSVGNEEIKVLVNHENGHDCVLPHKGMSMFLLRGYED